MSLISLVYTFNLLQFFIRRKNVLRRRMAFVGGDFAYVVET